MLHSTRAAKQFAIIVDAKKIDRSTIALAAISENAAQAAGAGWAEISIASKPRDGALLNAAAILCQK